MGKCRMIVMSGITYKEKQFADVKDFKSFWSSDSTESAKRKRLPDSDDNTNFDFTPGELGTDIYDLVKQGKIQEIIDGLPKILNLDRISYEEGLLLSSLVEDGHGDNLFSHVPRSIDLNHISRGGVILLSALFIKGHNAEIFERIDGEVSNIPISEELIRLFDILIFSYLNHEKTHNLLKAFESSLRIPIPHTKFEYTGKRIGPTVTEIINNFPLKPKEYFRWRSGWFRAELAKGDKHYVYINLNMEPPRILFRMDGVISEKSLEAYRKATEILPGYISSAHYPELEDDQKKARKASEPTFRPRGFREVFAGPTLEQINLSELPPSIRLSIVAQKWYIMRVLMRNKIYHGHLHEGNFNVRFLLTDKEGNKTIGFDLRKAIATARRNKEGISITPIVTLRDWDIANFED